MRESRRSERIRLPRGSTEIWLETQTPAPSKAEHRNPPQDTYEVWMEKRVEERRRTQESRG